MMSLTEGSDQNVDVEMIERSSESEPIQQEEKKSKVAYLRNSGIWALFPCSAHEQKQAKLRRREGSAHQFVSKLREDIWRVINTPERKEQIFLMEIRRYLVTHDRTDLVEKIKSRKDLYKLPSIFRQSFYHEKGWYFNSYLNYEVADEYQLLSLGRRDGCDECIPRLGLLNDVGNPLKADLQYQNFFSKLFEELQWDDTEEHGVRKTIEIRDEYFPDMNDRVIPWIIEYWTAYRTQLYRYWAKIDIQCQLWVRVEEEKGEFSKVLYDLTNESDDSCIQSDFEEIKGYVKMKRLNGRMKSTWTLIKEYFEARKLDPKPTGGDYFSYVKEKIRMALKLGIIQKEDVEKSDPGYQLLKDIERYDPEYFSCDIPTWKNYL